MSLLLLFFLLCSASLSSSEVALFSLPSTRVKAFRGAEDRRKRAVASLLRTPGDLLVSLIILNIVINIGVQNTAAVLFGNTSGWVLNVIVPYVLVLVFGEILPKSVGLGNNVRIATRVAPAMQHIHALLLPVRTLLLAVTQRLSHWLFFYLKPEREISLDELQYALKTSHQYGILSGEEAEFVTGYLHVREAHVKEHMRPREEVLFFDLAEPLSKLIALFVDEECSQIPLCKGGLDKVVGLITVQTFFAHKEDVQTPQDLLPLLKKPLFVPETMQGLALIRQFYENDESIALVVDEYGAIAGLISLEDIVEAIVGEISDRRDEKSRYTLIGGDVMIASGKLELADFEKVFSVSLPSASNVVTLGGWLVEQMGDIPKTGTRWSGQGFLFHVLASDVKRVRRIYVRKLG